MASATLYHNPRCSKSRQALQLLQEKGIPTKIIFYLETPPSIEELKSILKLLKYHPQDILRKNEPEYKVLRLDDPNHTLDFLIQTLHLNPKLLERPIVIINNKAVVARPPEKLLEILTC